MQTTTRKKSLVSTILALGFLAVLAPARGDLIVNGDFSKGLDGWGVSDPNFVSAGPGGAVISESPSAPEVDLFQTLTIHTGGGSSLSFKLLNLTGDPGNPVAAFGASLIDPNTLNPLVPPVDSFTDSFYTQDVGSPGRVAPSGVKLLPTSGDLPLSITVDISTLAAGTQAEILFRLIPGQNLIDGGSTNASVKVDSVTTSGGPNLVPEPSTALIVALGATSFVVYLGLRRKRRLSRS
jgi:hypothetical protein